MIQPPHIDYPLVTESATAERQMEGWMREVSDRINAMEVIDGDVSPEGVVFAPKKSQYFDEIGETLWFKTTDESLNTGWIKLG